MKRGQHDNAPELWAADLPWPTHDAHKHARGSLGVVTGPLGSTGAARLAARAGSRIGAGVCTLLCPPDALGSLSASVISQLTVSFSGAADLVAKSTSMDAVVIGPAAGVTPETRAHVEALGAAGRRLVLDADAITVFRGEADALNEALQAEAVLTPHAGEFERLWPGLLGSVGGSAAGTGEAVLTAARSVGAVVLLKGPETLIAAPDGRLVVNRHATPFLATAGSGDVLAGIIGGLMAQGMDAFAAACAGAWMHGDAGLRVGPGLVADDLDAALRDVIADLWRQSGRSRES